MAGDSEDKSTTGALGLQLSELVDLLRSLEPVGEEWAQAVADGVAEQDDFGGFRGHG